MSEAKPSVTKVAMVTGASGGIGLAICEVLSGRGYAVAALDIDLKPISSLASARDLPGRLLLIRADITSPAECERAVRESIQQFGQLDVLVNNAGICPRLSIDEVDEEKFDRIVAVNLKGCFFLSQKAIVQMRKQRSGRIINISSIAARTGGAIGASVYSAAKAGVIALTKSFARDLAPYNILVNAIAPGPTDTHMVRDLPEDQQAKVISAIPLSRLAKPKEIAELVAFLASEQSSYMTGATVDINGGMVMH